MTCPYDATLGIYDWQCLDCRARWYRNQPERLRGAIAKSWRATMPADELAGVKQRIEAWNANAAAAR